MYSVVPTRQQRRHSERQHDSIQPMALSHTDIVDYKILNVKLQKNEFPQVLIIFITTMI